MYVFKLLQPMYTVRGKVMFPQFCMSVHRRGEGPYSTMHEDRQEGGPLLLDRSIGKQGGPFEEPTGKDWSGKMPSLSPTPPLGYDINL